MMRKTLAAVHPTASCSSVIFAAPERPWSANRPQAEPFPPVPPANRRGRRPFQIMPLFGLLTTLLIGLLTRVDDSGAAAARSWVHHQLTVQIDPANGRLQVSDRLTFPAKKAAGLARQGLLLNAGLTVTGWEGATVVAKAKEEPCGTVRCLRHFVEPVVRLGPKIRLTVHYEGQLQGAPEAIVPQGATLFGSSVWYPQQGESLLRFELIVGVPSSWRSVSQGEQITQPIAPPSLTSKQQPVPVVSPPPAPPITVPSALADARPDSMSPSPATPGPPPPKDNKHFWSGWRSRQPTESIDLFAGPWFEYQKTLADDLHLYAFFRQDDPDLANRILDAAHQSILKYQELIGPYPYGKFAVVESHRQIGQSLPSLTLLGSDLLAQPSIPDLGLPHEILPNWWGNGVFDDPADGNWSEGLTTYLADHWQAEQSEEEAQYRHNALIRYGDSVETRGDFPLADFHARHDRVSQSVGADKGMFLFHQLRQRIGDQAFVAGLRRFYRENRFKQASFQALQQSMEQESGPPLSEFFQAWTRRTGGPTLQIVEAEAQPYLGGRYQVTVTLTQTSKDDQPYPLFVPFTLSLVGQPEPLTYWREMTQSRQSYTLTTRHRPIRLDVDASFDLFRTLHPQERPITLSRAFGAHRGLIIYPAESDPVLTRLYREVALAWDVAVTPDDALSTLPTHRTLWLFGKDNRFTPQLMKELYPFEVGEGVLTRRIQVRGKWYNDHQDAIVLAGQHPEDETSTLVLVATRPDRFPDILPILARQLPHYGAFSYLIFSEADGGNRVKGQWPTIGSPLSATFDDQGNFRPSQEPTVSRTPTPLRLPSQQVVVRPKTEEPPPLDHEALTPPSVIPPTTDTKNSTTPPPLPPSEPEWNPLPFGKQKLFPDPVVVPLSPL